MMKRILPLAAAFVTVAGPAFAHVDPAAHGSLMAGLSHPLFGIDHVLAMVAVGLWAALLGGRALVLVPAGFVAAMTAGYALALAGIPLPFMEPVILASVVVVGLLAAAALRVPAAAGMALVGFFAFFHGSAHGAELGAAGALAFGTGFAIATAFLHLTGLAAGAGLSRALGDRAGRGVLRIAGAATAIGGLALAFAG
jgi:urease accessory protein